MGGKQSVPQTNEAFSGRMMKFPSLSEDVLTKQELEEGVVILDTLRSFGNVSSASFMEIESDNTRFMMARAEADRIAEAEALRLATEQSIRVNDEGSIIYQGSMKSMLSRKESNLSSIAPSNSNVVLSRQSTNNDRSLILSESNENLQSIPSNKDIEKESELFDIITNKCGTVFSECRNYQSSGTNNLRELRNCNSEYAINKTADTCGCLGPKHDRFNCPICKGMHLEDAPLLY